MTHHLIVLDNASDYRNEHYGVMYESRNVFATSSSGRYTPNRIALWNNLRRPNPRNGERVRYGDYGVIDGGNGKFLDPQNKATDDTVSILITPESSVLCANTSMNTGQPGSGQVFAKDVLLSDGDTATLSYPRGLTREVTINLPRGHNGHGTATFKE